MAKYSGYALRALMFIMGVLFVVQSILGFFGESIFIQLSGFFGVSGAMAGTAFGAGMIIAGFHPELNVSWVRALLMYCVFSIVYELAGNAVRGGGLNIIVVIVSILVGIVTIAIYPNKKALFGQTA